MNTQPPAFGQQPGAFGAAPEPGSPAPVEEPAASGRRTVIIAVAAGVTALGVLGGAAALVLSGDGDDEVVAALPPASVAPVEPSVEPTMAPATPLPTAAIKGRNVFLPLVEDGDGTGESGDVVAPVDLGPLESTAPTTSPTSSPTFGGGGLIDGGTGGSGSLPVIEYVEIPGPTVTVTVSGPIETVPGPTVTEPGPTQTVTEPPAEVPVPGDDVERLLVSVTDTAPYLATFTVTLASGETTVYEDLMPGKVFAKVFTYIGIHEGTLVYKYGSTILAYTLPTPAPVPTDTTDPAVPPAD